MRIDQAAFHQIATILAAHFDSLYYVEIETGSKWVLTGDSYVTSLTCDADAIDLNGYTLYVNGVAYSKGSSSEGEALVFTSASSESGGHEEKPGDKPGDPPDGHGGPGGDGEPPAKPD